MSVFPNLTPGMVVDNSTLCGVFLCAPQGGMRRSNRTNSLVIVSNHVESVYEDKWLGTVFHYTGMGQEGDQSLDYSQNKTLAQSNTNGVKVFLFEVFEPQKYTYMGQVRLNDAPYEGRQPDRNGEMRRVWIFPLVLMDERAIILPEEVLGKREKRQLSRAQQMTDQQIQQRVQTMDSRPGIRMVASTTYERDVFVAEYTKRRAKGTCQLCGQLAPFTDLQGKPYLENHHIIWLSQGGKDSIDNTVALCPNCHRKMHVVNFADDIQKLLQTIK